MSPAGVPDAVPGAVPGAVPDAVTDAVPDVVTGTPPAAPLPSVTAVVPTYRRRDGLEAAVRALLGDPGTTELVVVVDGSPDGSLELLQGIAAEDPRLRPVWQENAGGAAARQTGIDLATGDVVLLVDDDVVAAPGLASGHARHHALADDLVVLGYMPTRVPVDLVRGGFATRVYAEEYEGTCRAYERDPEEVLLRLWGGNVSVRRDRLARVPYDSGPFSRTNHSDRDWGIRLRKAGLRGVFDRSLLASHEHSRPLPAFLRDARAQGAGRYGVHVAHADVLPPFGLRDTVADLPAPLRGVLGLDRYRVARAGLVGGLHAVTRTASRAGVVRVEVPAAKLLRRLAMRDGIRDAMAAPPPADPGHPPAP